MTRQTASISIALMLCLAVTLAQAAQRGREGGNAAKRNPERSGTKNEGERTPSRGSGAPGGNWSDRTHKSGPAANEAGAQPRSGSATGANNAARRGQNPTASGAQGAAAGAAAANRKAPQATGAEGAAVGTAAKNRNAPQASGAEGAAAGAAAKNRNAPQATGAEGAAAGAAAANRNAPQASGAQGAAAGAAAANRKAPQATGAEGAAAGAAAANRNAPQVSGAQGAAAGAAAANRNEPQVSGAEGAAAGAAAVRNSYNNPHLYDEQWYGAHPDVWAPSGLTAGAAWTPTNWGAVASYCGADATPVAYNYGTNVTCQDGNVTVDGQDAGTAAQFSQQAADLAQTGATADAASSDDWLPLGVFAMVRNEQQHPQLIMQLAINKQGILRGNYTDELTEHTQTIQGAVDPKTQRAAWTVGKNQTSVMEAGLSNLSQGEAPALIHRNGKTDHWLLVRLDQPGQDPNAAGGPANPQ